jgi:hypothetical protein
MVACAAGGSAVGASSAILAGHRTGLSRIRESKHVLTGFSCSAITCRAELATLSVEAINSLAPMSARLDSLRNVSMSRLVTA